MRIGYDGPRAPTLATIQALHALHPARIPFECLDPLLGRPVALDLPAIEAKLVRGRRGGYCFEQNALFAAALEALGLPVTRLGARVRWNAPPGRPEGPRSHMLLRAEFPEGPHLLDIGFGGYLLSAPVRFERGTEQRTTAGTVRFAATAPDWLLQAKLPSGWTDLYRFNLEPQLPADYVVSNWFTSTHPDSPFVSNLIAQRLTPEGRMNLLNATLTLHRYHGASEERRLPSPGALTDTLETIFGIKPPASPAELWKRVQHA